MEPSRPCDEEPAAVVSLPCPRCGAGDDPDPACPVCTGEGIVLRRVPAARAGDPVERLRDLGEPWPPTGGEAS